MKSDAEHRCPHCLSVLPPPSDLLEQLAFELRAAFYETEGGGCAWQLLDEKERARWRRVATLAKVLSRRLK